MDYDKLIHCLKCCARVDAQNTGCDDCELEYCGEECQQLCGTAATAIETLRAESIMHHNAADNYFAEANEYREERNDALTELEQMAACIYYKPGGLCRYGGDDPANMCVLGPCPHEKSAEDILADLARVTAERDALIKRTAGDCWSCVRRYECNSRKGPHSRCWEFDPWLLKED